MPLCGISPNEENKIRTNSIGDMPYIYGISPNNGSGIYCEVAFVCIIKITLNAS